MLNSPQQSPYITVHPGARVSGHACVHRCPNGGARIVKDHVVLSESRGLIVFPGARVSGSATFTHTSK